MSEAADRVWIKRTRMLTTVLSAIFTLAPLTLGLILSRTRPEPPEVLPAGTHVVMVAGRALALSPQDQVALTVLVTVGAALLAARRLLWTPDGEQLRLPLQVRWLFRKREGPDL